MSVVRFPGRFLYSGRFPGFAVTVGHRPKVLLVPQQPTTQVEDYLRVLNLLIAEEERKSEKKSFSPAVLCGPSVSRLHLTL